MTAEEYKEFLNYKCNGDCKNCKYHVLLFDKWGCIEDLNTLSHDIVDDAW
jgi:hypothetical protein